MSEHIRRFELVRDEDLTGISGTGVVAWGCQFPDGKTVLRWKGEVAQVSVWEGIKDVVAIHGHGGHTYIHWLDPMNHRDRNLP